MTPPLTVGLPSYGRFLGTAVETGRAVRALAVEAEHVGVARVSVSDHVVMGSDTGSYPYGAFAGEPDEPWLEPLTVLASIGAVTSTLRLATGVLISPLRPPALLAKAAATLDVLTEGRLDLGVGMGWQAKEYEAAGLRFADRGQLFTDGLAACQALWGDGPATFDSATLSFEGVWCRPQPVQPHGVPLWIGGELSAPNLDRIVQFGRGWIPAPTARWTQVVADLERLRSALRSAGRDPNEVAVRTSPAPRRGSDGRLDFPASFARVPEQVAAGATDVFVLLESWCPEPARAPETLAAMVRALDAATG